MACQSELGAERWGCGRGRLCGLTSLSTGTISSATFRDQHGAITAARGSARPLEDRGLAERSHGSGWGPNTTTRHDGLAFAVASGLIVLGYGHANCNEWTKSSDVNSLRLCVCTRAASDNGGGAAEVRYELYRSCCTGRHEGPTPAVPYPRVSAPICRVWGGWPCKHSSCQTGERGRSGHLLLGTCVPANCRRGRRGGRMAEMNLHLTWSSPGEVDHLQDRAACLLLLPQLPPSHAEESPTIGGPIIGCLLCTE